VYFDLILHPTTNLYSYSVRTLIDILAQVLDSFQSSRDLHIDITIKEKKKLRTVRDHILIGKPGPIVFKYQTIIRPSIEWITVLSPVYFLVLEKAFTILSINHTFGLEIVNTI